MRFERHVCRCGLEVVAEVDDAALSSSAGIFVRTGARNETPDIMGVSHFLEHMQFKGTSRRDAIEVNRAIDALGGHCNAYTSEDHTVYYLHVIPRQLEDAIELLVDIMRPTLRDEDFEMERQVILEEIAMYDDQPPYGAMEMSMEQYFGDHPLAYRVLGTAGTVSAMTSDAMRHYHTARYAPDNLVLVLTGAVDWQAVVAACERLTEAWPSPSQPAEAARPALLPARRPFDEAIQDQANQHYLISLQPAPSAVDPSRYAWHLAASAVGDERGSRLFWVLSDPGLVESVGMSLQLFEDCGLLHTFMTCSPEMVASNWSLLRETVAKVRGEPITQRELDLVRNRSTAAVVMAAERPSSRLFSVGTGWLYHRRYFSLDEILAGYAAVDLGQVNDIAREIVDSPMTLTAVGPQSIAESIAAPR